MTTDDKIEKVINRVVKKYAERDLYTLEQAAHRLCMGRNRIKSELINKGLLAVVIIGSKVMVPRCEIERFINQNLKIKRSA